jgi:exodeoxyribonuclease VII large subunit
MPALTNAAEFTVSEIANAVKRTVEDEFGHVRVRGEISGFRGQHSSGHAYFTLKDEGAALDAVVWKGTWPKLAFKPEEGLEVIATGRLTTFPRSSKYQIVIEQIEPAGVGALMALLEDRRKKLLGEGLFAAERKRPLPYLPSVIGVITSPTGAVIRDILHRISDRFPSHVLVWPVRVQGDTCAPEVTAAIEGFNALPMGGKIPRPDILIVARGGGSIEDLWGFNEESVVRAVAASAIPVITAVGHETDTTLVDYASDHRAPTPTAAAEAAVPVRAELIGYVDDLGGRLRHGMRRVGGEARDRLRAASRGLPKPQNLVGVPRQRLDLAATGLVTALRHAGQKKRIRFGEVAPRLAPGLLSRQTRDLSQKLGRLTERHRDGARLGLERRDRALERLASRLTPQRLQVDIRHAGERIDRQAERLLGAFRRGVEKRRERYQGAARLLDTVSYRAVLERGFAVVTDAKGQIVKSVTQVATGDAVVLTLADGEAPALIGGDWAPVPPAIVPATPVAQPKKKKPAGKDDGQESLF